MHRVAKVPHAGRSPGDIFIREEQSKKKQESARMCFPLVIQ